MSTNDVMDQELTLLLDEGEIKRGSISQIFNPVWPQGEEVYPRGSAQGSTASCSIRWNLV